MKVRLSPEVALCMRRPVAPYTAALRLHNRLAGNRGKTLQIMLLIPSWLAKVVTPLKWEGWEAALREHRDPVCKWYIYQVIQRGFSVGFDYRTECHLATRNMPSAQSNPAVVHKFLEKELRAQRIYGPV